MAGWQDEQALGDGIVFRYTEPDTHLTVHHPRPARRRSRSWWRHFGVMFVADLALVAAGYYLAVVTDPYPPNPHRWPDGDGPETVCVYEYLADGSSSLGGGRTWTERWTVCDPGDQP